MISLDTPPSAEVAHDSLLTTLRAEIEEYGGLLALFDQQQEAILARDPDRVVDIAEELERQAEAAKTRRKEREAVVAQMNPYVASGKPASISDLLPLMREPVRPLVETLRDEINRLVSQTKRRAQQNQMLLSRTIETSEELLRRLNPDGAATPTYSPEGRIKRRGTARSGRLLSRR